MEARQKPHVCFVAPNAFPLLSGDFSNNVLGGAELQQVTLARELVSRGYRVSMVCFDFGQPDAVEIDGIVVYKTYRLDAGIPVIRFLYPRVTSVWAALNRADADIYYTRTASMVVGLVAAFGKIKNKKTLFAAASNSDFSMSETRIKYRRDLLIFKYGLRNSSKILVQNEEQERLCRINYGRNPLIIRNCYAFPGVAEKRPRLSVLWVSTIRRVKRPELFLDLAVRLPHLEFVMVGGPDRFQAALYQEIVRRADELANVDFRGFVPYSEVDPYFDRARVVINTSSTEGFPNTFLQAWARAVPTVSFFDCQARQGKDRIGYCVESLEEMVQVVDRLFSDDHEYEKAGEMCLQYFAQWHSVSSVADSFEKVLLELMSPVSQRE